MINNRTRRRVPFLMRWDWRLLYFLTAGIFLFFIGSIVCMAEGDKPAEVVENIQNASRSIPFQLIHDKIILTAKIGDSGPLKLILDSGMGWDGVLIYNPDLRDKIKLIDPHDALIAGAGSGKSPTSRFSEGMNFSIGGIEFRNQKVVVLLSDSFKGFPTDGVVGYSLLGHHAIEIDYDKSTLTLHDFTELKADNTWTSLPLYFKEHNIPWIDITISVRAEEPANFACYIDSAARDTVVLLTKEDQSFTVPDDAEDVCLGRGLNGDIHGRQSTLSRILIGPYELKDATVAFVPADVRSKQPSADGVIGNGLLKRFNLIFDYEHKRLYLRQNANF